MDNFLNNIGKGLSFLASNADKLAVGYGGILQQRANISLMKQKANAQLAALQAQAANSKAQAAIANATAETAANNPTVTSASAQLKNSPLMIGGIVIAVVGLAFVAFKAAKS